MISSIRNDEDSFCCFRSINSEGIRVCWEIIADCNLKCHHCMVYKPVRKGLDHKRKLEIVNELASLNVKKILISGGEPFLYKGLNELCHSISQKGILVDINTNATLFTREKLQSIKENGVSELTISLDGSNKSVYEKSRPNADFEIVINNIDTAVKLGFNVDLVFVPTRINSADMEQVADLAYNMGAKSLTIAGLIKFQAAEKNWDYLYLSHSELLDLKNRIINLRTILNLPIRSNRIFSSLPMSPCGAGKTVLGIDSSGYVHPCALYILSNSSSNDLMKHKLADIVESYEFKSKIPAIESMDGCNECKFLQNCFGGCHGAKRMANIQLNFPDPICKTSYEI